MHSLSRWFKQVVIVVAVLGLLTSAWPGVAQGERPPSDLQSISSLKKHLRAGDLPPVLDQLQACSVSPSQSSPTPAEMDWTLAVYQTICNGSWDINVIDRNQIWPNGRLTQTQDHDIEPSLNRAANRVVFSRALRNQQNIYKWHLFTINVDGTSLAQLTEDNNHHRKPVWSPDGSRIAFAYQPNSDWEIYVMNADGSNPAPLTVDLADDLYPAWSPDGSQIAWIKGGTGGAIWIMNADGSNQHPLTPALAYAQNLRWSPDGTHLALDYDRDGDTMNELAIINADGTGLHTVFDLHDPTAEMWLSSWSPDGQRLTYARVIYLLSGGQVYLAYGSVSQVSIDGVGPYSFYVSCANSYNVDWAPLERELPVSSMASLPVWSLGTFYVAWTGNDVGPSGIATYDIQVKDGAAGSWIDWKQETPDTSGTYTGLAGHTYYFRSRAHDRAFNLESYPVGNGDTSTTVDLTPPSSTASAPAIAASPQFLMAWNGSDAASGIASYDVQYRDGPLGPWTDWITSTTQTSLQFNGQLGHIYYFQSRARDKVGNLEAYPNGDGDTHTNTPLYALSGTVKGNRDQAVALALAQTTPAALNQSMTDHRGNFSLYFNLSDTFSLTATRRLFGALPPMPNVIVSDTASSPIVYLPPLDDQIGDGHFESGNLLAWNPIGLLTPTITLTAHTGNYAAWLGGTIPSDTVDTAPYLSAIEQTITVPFTLTDGTLSLLYQVTAADPLSDTLSAYLIGPTETLTFTLPITATDWTHQWFDVSAWTAPTATLRLELAAPDTEHVVGVLVDEVTWGSSIVGSHPIYLPIMRR